MTDPEEFLSDPTPLMTPQEVLAAVETLIEERGLEPLIPRD